jgi:hypothetical protein
MFKPKPPRISDLLRNRAIGLGCLLCSFSGQALAATQSPLTFTQGSAGTWNANWSGESGRTYFLEWSTDLSKWNSTPFIEFGAGAKSYAMPTQGAARLFVKLHYVDDPAVTTLQQAQAADFDGDGMPNLWELTYGLNPTNHKDALEDLDGDRIPNVYEFVSNTLPSLSTSIPATHITIDPSAVTESLTLKRTIQAGISDVANKNRYTIIRVKPGNYPESLDINDNSYKKRILFLGDLGANLPVIAPTSGNALRIQSSSVVFDGFALTWGGSLKTSTGYGVFFSGNTASDQARLVNCTVSGFRSANGSAANVSTGLLTFEHCTIADNASWEGGKAIFLQSAGSLSLINSIVWNPATTVTTQIYQTTPGSATVTSCIVLGGELGASAAAPKMDRYYGLMPGSPAIGAGMNKSSASLDRHG